MLLTISTGIVITLFIMILSLVIGRYFQNKHNLLISNSYISFAIGFAIYIAILTLFFMPIIIFKGSGVILFSTWWFVNCIVILFLYNKRKTINIKNIAWKQLIYFGLGWLIVLVTIRFLSTSQGSNENYFYVPWVRGNEYAAVLNKNLNGIWVSNSYFGQGWYYFQTAILRTTHMDQNFFNAWVCGSIVATLSISTTFGLTYNILRRHNFFTCFFAIGCIFLITWLLTNNQTPNIGTIGFIWNFVLMFVIALNFLSSPRISQLFLLVILNFAGWSFDYSQIFIGFMFWIIIGIILVYKRSHLFWEFILTFLTSILLTITIFIYPYSQIAFWFTFLIWLGIAIAVFSICKYRFIQIRNWSICASKYRHWISSGILLIFVCLSFIFWATNTIDPWLSFKYNNDGLWKYNTTNNVVLITTYAIYWILFCLSILLIISSILKNIGEDKVRLLQLIAAITFVFFFNPLVASFFNDNFLPQDIYNLVRLLAFVPYILCIPIYLSKIKVVKYSTIIIPIAGIGGIYATFWTNDEMKENYNIYTGQNIDINLVGDWINHNTNNYLGMAGDIDGVSAYVNNPLSFQLSTSDYQNTHNNFLTEDIYKKVDNNLVGILIKRKDHINVFDFTKFGFIRRESIGKYWVYIK